MFNHSLGILLICCALLSPAPWAQAADPTLTPLQQGQILGALAVSPQLESDARGALQKLLAGQTYEWRISIVQWTVTSVTETKNTRTVTCSIQIGEDDQMDDDSGWGSLWAVDAVLTQNKKDNTWKVDQAVISMLAG